jgi:outer membrane protein assembly factor BamB
LLTQAKNASASSVLNVYASTGDGTLYKLVANNGAAVWHTQITDRNLPAPPAVANGVVYFGTLSGNFYALNASTGQPNWHIQLGDNIISSPVVVNNVVYVGSDNDYIYALNSTNGSILWRFDAGVGNETVATRSVAVVNGVVYGSSSDLTNHSYLFAINASTGQQIWRVKVLDQLFTNVQVVNNVVYLASSAITQEGGPRTTDSYVYAYDAKTGTRLWISGKIGDVIPSAPAISNGIVYVGSQDTFVYALNATTGARLWRHQLNGPITTSPIVANGVIFVGLASGPSTAAPSKTSDATTTTGSIVALDASTGNLIWQQKQITDYLGTPLAYSNNLLYVGTNTNQVYAFNASTGLQSWSFQMSSAVPFDNAPIAIG